jgi:hypothetical protein
MPPIFSINYNYNCNEISAYRWCNLQKVEGIFPQSPLHYQNTLLRETLYAGRVKLFAEA